MFIFSTRPTFVFAAIFIFGLATGCAPDKKETYKTDDTPDQFEVKKEVELEKTKRPVEADSAARYLIADSVAGRLRINMPTTEIEKKISAGKLNKTLKMQEGMVFTIYEIKNRNGELALIAEETCTPDCFISRITIKDPRYQTNACIGVGSTFGEIKECHPIKYISTAEGNLTVVTESPRVSFMLNKTQVNKPLPANPALNQIPDSTRVVSILVY